MSVILVEGESDRIALDVLAERFGVTLPPVLPVGGSKGARRAAAQHDGEPLLGMVDARERADFDRVPGLEVFVCDPDLEGEFIRAIGVDAVLALIAAQGELPSFRRLQQQPAQRTRTAEQQLERFFGGRSGNKARYAALLARAVDIDRMPGPIAALFAAVAG